ncbi:hypothetical protein ACQP2E_38025 [Actinoplanes sp. CA-015351]|uniref:hypothetical protein n=1 Tax=Actinoplanes sp. CA-015351 TaxID=3239897 RepID=UPI003D9619B5
MPSVAGTPPRALRRLAWFRAAPLFAAPPRSALRRPRSAPRRPALRRLAWFRAAPLGLDLVDFSADVYA